MESQIAKMYENAGVEFIIGVHCRAKIGDGCKSRCPDCDYNTKPKEYPQFTAEKQIELIKKLGNINIDTDNGCYMSFEILEVKAHCDTFEETLAEFVNNLWQDLTEQERTEIADILRG